MKKPCMCGWLTEGPSSMIKITRIDPIISRTGYSSYEKAMHALQEGASPLSVLGLALRGRAFLE